MTTAPTLAQFLEAARREFGYLSSDFGFTESPHGRNEYAIRYIKSDADILIEGINWGFGVNVLLGHGIERVPLWAIAKARGQTPVEIPAGQLERIKHNAKLLREWASDVLEGDFTVFPAASRVVAENAAQIEKPSKPRLP